MKALAIRRYKAPMEMMELPRPEPGPAICSCACALPASIPSTTRSATAA